MLLNELAQDVQQDAIFHKALDSHSKALINPLSTPYQQEGCMNYLITRHIGALEWLLQEFKEPVIHLDHLEDFSRVGRGDTVIGTLPVNRIAEVCCQGARYLHLEIDLPQHLRGRELTARQLVVLGAELVEYHAHRPIPDEALLRMAAEREEG